MQTSLSHFEMNLLKTSRLKLKQHNIRSRLPLGLCIPFSPACTSRLQLIFLSQPSTEPILVFCPRVTIRTDVVSCYLYLLRGFSLMWHQCFLLFRHFTLTILWKSRYAVKCIHMIRDFIQIIGAGRWVSLF